MEWVAILLGMLVGFILISVTKRHEREPPTTSTLPIDNPPLPTRPIVQSTVFVPQRPAPIQTQPQPSLGQNTVSTKALLAKWRNSIIGLIRLSERNLTIASQCMERGDHRASVEAALTSVENISRALLHCYGEKPELSTGQIEPLRLLALRFTGTEKGDFGKVIDQITQLRRRRIVRLCLAKSNTEHSFQFTRPGATHVLDSASAIATAFTRIIKEQFIKEIPELEEICPQCSSTEVGVLSFNATLVNFTCNKCRHSWAQTRN